MIDVNTIFFDVDGTLVDARDDIANAVNYTLTKLGLKKRPMKSIVSYIGTGVKDLIAKSLGSKNSALSGEAVEIFSRYYVDHSADDAKLYPHTQEVLEYFKDKRKIILTNRYSKFADITLIKLGIRHYFEGIIGGDDESCLKPSACVLDTFSPKLDKDKAIIVGDMDIDIMTGKNSGVKTCWVTYGLGKSKDVRKLKPDFVIDDMLELESIIQ